MPRPQRAYGRPGTQVIPPDWETSHAQVMTGTFPDLVSLRAPGGTPAWNPGNHRTEVTANTPFATRVPARIHAIGADAQNTAADDVVRVAGYDVWLPLDGDGVDAIVVDGEQDTLIDVTSSQDPMLTGKTLQVTGVIRGTSRFERHLLATLND